MHIYRWILLSGIFIFGTKQTHSARILALFPFQGKSHYVMFEAIVKALVEKGHQVDVLNHFPQKEPIPGLTDLSIRGTLPLFVNNMTIDFARSLTVVGGVYAMLTLFGSEICETILNTDVAKQLKESDVKYDLLITEIFGTDCMLGFGHHFKIPTVGLISSVALPWTPEGLGLPDNPSYIPSYLLPLMAPMSLPERVLNTVTTVFSKLAYYYYSTLPSDAHMREFFGNDVPSLEELRNQFNFLLVNSHFSMNGARPTTPNVAEIGGVHIKPEGQLPQKFVKKMDASTNGVIYFSLGSMVLTETFPKHKQRALIDAFGELPYTVYWKAVGDKFPGPIPDNIVFEPWMPQMEMLCHPNTKVFITHGGLMGTQEAVYCGVPMVGIPIFGDQELNIQTYERFGLAVQLNYNTLSKENVLSALRTILDNPKYAENTKEKSKLFRDRPLSARDTATYWLEYVIRHKGAPHLRPKSVDLSWFQLHLIDVAFVIFCLIAGFMLIFYLIVTAVMKIRNGTKKSEKQKQK